MTAQRLRSIVLATLALSALAACPLQCNNNGYCNSDDRCICYRLPGTKAGPARPAFVGADCSLRTCPYGRANGMAATLMHSTVADEIGFASADGTSQPRLALHVPGRILYPGDLNVEVEVQSVWSGGQAGTLRYSASDAAGSRIHSLAPVSGRPQSRFQPGMYDFAVASAQLTSPATALEIRPVGLGTSQRTGLYIYMTVSASDPAGVVAEGDRYWFNATLHGGMHYSAHDESTAHQLLECSGNGKCKRQSGTCVCDPGFTGDACERNLCPRDCSGHGVCQSERVFAEAGGSAYSAAFDSETSFGCLCDAGFRGADCSLRECPSGVDPLGGPGAESGRDCSGRGTCDERTGVCQCFTGYVGARCEELSNFV